MFTAISEYKKLYNQHSENPRLNRERQLKLRIINSLAMYMIIIVVALIDVPRIYYHFVTVSPAHASNEIAVMWKLAVYLLFFTSIPVIAYLTANIIKYIKFINKVADCQ